MRKTTEAKTRDLIIDALTATAEMRGLLNKMTNRNAYNRRLSKAQLKNLSARARLKEFAVSTNLFSEEELQNL